MTELRVELRAEYLMALSAADVEDELWHWESPLMGGARQPVATLPRIDFVVELTAEELAQLVKALELQGLAMANSGIASHEASDDEVLIALGSVNESKKWDLVSRQVTAWNEIALKAISIHNIVVGNDDDIDGFLKTEHFRGIGSSKTIAAAIAKFGEEAVVTHAITKIHSLREWWDYADYLSGASYEAADKAYTNMLSMKVNA
jgi:hypothetical protein